MAKDIPSASEPSSPTTSQDHEENQQRSGRKSSSKVSKPRLTAHQKNTNHKDAENKRRNAIREQFTELSRLVPGAEGQERSEYVMLQKTIAYFRDELQKRRDLTEAIEAKGGTVPDDMKLIDNEWGGSQWKAKNADEFEKTKAKRKGTSNGDGTQNADAEGEDD